MQVEKSAKSVHVYRGNLLDINYCASQRE